MRSLPVTVHKRCDNASSSPTLWGNNTRSAVYISLSSHHGSVQWVLCHPELPKQFLCSCWNHRQDFIIHQWHLWNYVCNRPSDLPLRRRRQMASQSKPPGWVSFPIGHGRYGEHQRCSGNHCHDLPILLWIGGFLQYDNLGGPLWNSPFRSSCNRHGSGCVLQIWVSYFVVPDHAHRVAEYRLAKLFTLHWHEPCSGATSGKTLEEIAEQFGDPSPMDQVSKAELDPVR